MLNILAETFRIATFTDRPADRAAPTRGAHDPDRWFWQGRRWQAPCESR